MLEPVLSLCICVIHWQVVWGNEESLNGPPLFLTGAKGNVFSDVIMNQNQKPAASLSESPYIDFFNHHLAGRTKDSADSPDMSTYQPDPSAPVTGSGGDKDSSIKDMEAALKVEATLVLRWKVIQE